MSPEERDRIRLLKRQYDEAWIAYDRFGDRLPTKRLEEYYRFKAEYDKISEEQLEEALQLSKAEEVAWCKKYLTDLVIAYRIQLALQLHPEPDDLWESIQPFIDEEINIFDTSAALPVQVVDTKDFRAKQLLDKQMLDEPAPTKIAKLILQLWDYQTEEDIKKLVYRAKEIPGNHPLLAQINLIGAIMDYLDEIIPEEKQKQKPQRGLLNTFKSALTHQDNQPETPTLTSIFEEIEIWQSKSVEELGYHQMAILGTIRVLTQLGGLSQSVIDSHIKVGYERWIGNYNRKR